MKKSVKIFFEVLLFILCIGLVYLIVKSVMKPVEFKKQQQYRESVAIQRLKDIRTLQVAYKSENGKFVSTVDSLADFYNNGKMEIVMQIGSMDDSLAVAHTDKIKKASRKKLTGEDLLKLYEAGDKNLVFNVATKIPVKDTLFLHRDDFVVDSLKQFYENGNMEIVMQIGSMDDSLAVANTEAIKKANRNLKGDQLTAKLQEAYAAGQNVVYSTTTKIPVRDTLFNGRQDFCIDSIKYIPFSGKPIEMESAIRMVSGVPVPLFEARIPWKILLVGMDNQLRINLDAEMRDLNRYEGLQVGSVTAPNNNAGNWE